MEEKERIINKTASLFNSVAIVVVVVGLLIALFIFFTVFENGMISVIAMASELVGTFVIWFIVRSVSEIIQLLEDIKNK